MNKPIITYRHAGWDGANKPITAVFADGIRINQFITPSMGISSSYQELELDQVDRICQKLYPNGFVLPYYVDSAGYVFKNN